MFKRQFSNVNGSSVNIRKIGIEYPPEKKQKDTPYDDLTGIERAQYINGEYKDHPEWMINYPHNVVQKCKDLTVLQVALYNQYYSLQQPTIEDAIHFVSTLTIKQIATTGI
tara:strand:+ start:5175 stop:5507 length:333 start_codon:yes stop_codon:yes gene_type:complete